MESEQPVGNTESQGAEERRPVAAETSGASEAPHGKDAPPAKEGQGTQPTQEGDRRGRDPRRDRFRRGDRRGRGGDRGGDRGERNDQGDRGNRGDRPPQPSGDGGQRPAGGIRDAMRHIERIRGDLRRVLDEMSEVIKILDQAEREKTASEDEIEKLRDSLEELQQGRGYGRQPRYQAPPQRSAPAQRPTPAVEEEAEARPESAEDEREGNI